MSARTGRRRRRQAANNYRHLSKMQRPRYKKRDPIKSRRKMMEMIERQKAMTAKAKK